MATKKEVQEKPETVEAVCLMDCGFGAGGSVQTLSPEDAETGKANGMLDLSQAAIDYAKSIKE